MMIEKQINKKKAAPKDESMNMVSGILFSLIALMIITLGCWAYSYGNYAITEIAAERAEKKAAKECYEAAFAQYENGSYYESLNLIVGEYSVKYKGVLPEKDTEIEELYTLVEQGAYEQAMALLGDTAVDACNTYIESFPNGKHLDEINAWLEENKFPDALFFMKNLDPVKNSDGTYSFKGFFTKCETSFYAPLAPTLYVACPNGEVFSTGESALYYKMYIDRNGEYGVVLNDLLNHPSKINGILFEFVYDKNGNFKELKQIA